MRESQCEVTVNRETFVRGLHMQYARQLQRTVRRYTDGDPQWAEDVVQETMLRAWRHADRLQRGGYPSLLPWLTTVARHVVSNDRRGMRARPPETDGELLAVLASPDHADGTLDRALIRRALSQLSKPHRDVIVAVYLHGWSLPDVAGALNVPLGTVKSRAHYALRVLRSNLSGER